ncbi:hypothetical protein E5676_scaffold124G00260 [Cucumis melo var. makuwa]|uniref:Uncharacterized protein n=1 Tax=Cucumis melo var. makuwa TaxID=1194695 RepID=A0A5A7TL53_CUCMM|nr:hypothetical protein E6C27_scaffold67G006580 [Cucumis melo var. makuwa]TYK26740.1 hypothetical protein E5676_scaffold124G00260 [Cucumis melo var. makuwa]
MDDPCHAPPCPYLASFHHFSVASITVMVVQSKEKCNKLILESIRDEERQEFIGRLSVWKDEERMRNVSEITTCIAIGQRNTRWILIEPFWRQRRNATVAK